MRSSWKLVLRPVASAAWWYLGLVILREILRLAGNYSMSATFRVLDLLRSGNGAWCWAAFLGGLALYFEISLRVNGRTLWYMTRNVNVPLYKHMRMTAFTRFLDLPLRWHQRHNSAILTGEVNNGIDRVHEIVDTAGWELAPLVAATVLSLGPLIWLSPVSTAVVAAGSAVFLLLNYRIYLVTEPYRIAHCDSQREDWMLSSECVRRLPAVLMANAGPRLTAEYERIQRDIAFNTAEEYRWEAFRYGRWRDRLMSWTQVALIGIWLHQLLHHTLSVVDCVYLWRVCEDLFAYVENYSGLFERFVNNTEPVRRFFAVLEESPRAAVARRAAQPAPEPLGIEFRDVRFAYDSHAPCLGGLNLRVKAGETIAVTGRSGSGKSTLAKLACGLFEPDGGDVLIGGRSVRDWDAAELRSRIAYVPQLNETAAFERTVADNIRFAVPDAPLDKVMEAAQAAELHDDILKMPLQYETLIGESGCTLSGGQLQRLAIARELLKDAPVFILDEPTSAQDAATEARILCSLAPRLASKTVILISHRPRTVRRLASKIAVVDSGRIVKTSRRRRVARLARYHAHDDTVSRRLLRTAERPRPSRPGQRNAQQRFPVHTN